MMHKDNPFYDTKLLIKYALIIVSFTLLCKFTGGVAYPILVPFALYYVMLRQYEKMLFVVLIDIASIVCNSWFMPKPMVYAVTQRGLLVVLGFFLFSMLFGQRHSPQLSSLRGFLWYIVYMIFVSFNGWSPLVSGLKIFLFLSVFLSFYSSSNSVAQQRTNMLRLRSMVLAVISFYVIGSILVIPFPAIGNMGYDEIQQMIVTPVSLFKGMTTHSQTLGPVIAMCGIVLFGDFVFSIQRNDKLYILLLMAIPFLIIKTSSRTAMGGLIGGVLFIFWCVTRARTVSRSWRTKIVSGMLLTGALLSMVVLVVPSARESAVRFAVKYTQENEKVEWDKEKIMASRQGKIDDALYNWSKSPVIGNGFQVSQAMVGFQANSLAHIITAPVEKSVWIYAILEEGGVVGEIIFCIISVFIITALLRHRAFIGVSCYFTMLILNLGEFSMFSLSGVGGFIWGMVFVGCILDARREYDFKLVSRV